MTNRRHTTPPQRSPTLRKHPNRMARVQRWENRRVSSRGSCLRGRVCVVPPTPEPKAKAVRAPRGPRRPSQEVAQGVECEGDEDEAGDPVQVRGPKGNHPDSQGQREPGSRLQQFTAGRERHASQGVHAEHTPRTLAIRAVLGRCSQ